MDKILKIPLLLIIVGISFFSCSQSEGIRDQSSVESEEDIQKALNEIKEADPVQYQTLIKLKEANSKDFKSRLHNYYYILKYNEKALKKMPKRPLGYRELVKISDKKLSDLNQRYKTAKNAEELSKIESEINVEAESRYEIELFHKVFQITFSEKELNSNEKEKLKDFEKNKTDFINRIVTKVKSM